MSFLNMKPIGPASPLSKAVSKATRKSLFPEAYPSDAEIAAKKAEEDAIKNGPGASPALPDQLDPNIREAQRLEAIKNRKRKGYASTILTGQLGDPVGRKTMLG